MHVLSIDGDHELNIYRVIFPGCYGWIASWWSYLLVGHCTFISFKDIIELDSKEDHHDNQNNKGCDSSADVIELGFSSDSPEASLWEDADRGEEGWHCMCIWNYLKLWLLLRIIIFNYIDQGNIDNIIWRK